MKIIKLITILFIITTNIIHTELVTLTNHLQPIPYQQQDIEPDFTVGDETIYTIYEDDTKEMKRLKKRKLKAIGSKKINLAFMHQQHVRDIDKQSDHDKIKEEKREENLLVKEGYIEPTSGCKKIRKSKRRKK